MGSSEVLLKKKAALAALDYLHTHFASAEVLGIGTGSTVNQFILSLKKGHHPWRYAVSSSSASTLLLQQQGLEVIALNDVARIPVYIDGADEINPSGWMLKGGGGALCYEKIIAAASEKFMCIASHSKYVATLGRFPLAVEVLPMARNFVLRQLQQKFPTHTMNLRLDLAQNVYLTEEKREILDVHGLQIQDGLLEQEIESIPGVVTCGLFVKNQADWLFLAKDKGVEMMTFQRS